MSDNGAGGLDGLDLSGITIRDLRELEKVLGKPIGSVFEAMAGGDMSGLTADTMAGLIWLRMRKDDPELTYDAVLDLDLAGLSGGSAADPKATGAPTQ